MEDRGAERTDSVVWPRPISTGMLLVILLLIAAALHVYAITQTAVVARDSIGYIRYALMLEQLPFGEALRTLQQHPLYPAGVLAASWPIRHFLGTTTEAMILACQLVSALAGILLVVPMFLLACEWFDRRGAFWGTALFQCLPVAAQVTADGLSDGVYLLMLGTALLFAVRGMRTHSGIHFGLAGLATGFAYLTRPEGAFVAVAALLVLLGVQTWASTRWPWRRACVGTASLLAGAAIVAGPYMLTIGGITVKPGALKILSNAVPLDTIGDPADTHSGTHDKPTGATSGPLFAAAPLAIWWMDEGHGSPPTLSWGVKAVVLETSHAFHYVGWLPALLGLWWYRDRFRKPGPWVMLALCVILGLLLVRVAMGIHYLAERHALVLTLCGCVWAGPGMAHMADWVPRWLEWWLRRPLASRPVIILTTVLLAASTTWCLPVTLKPLHANRIGHREAGRWLGQHAQPGDAIVDPYCWANFYSGRIVGAVQPDQRNDSPTQFVVLTQSKNPHSRLFGMDKAQELRGKGTVVFRWTPSPRQVRRYHAEEVVVYQMPLEVEPTH